MAMFDEYQPVPMAVDSSGANRTRGRQALCPHLTPTLKQKRRARAPISRTLRRRRAPLQQSLTLSCRRLLLLLLLQMLRRHRQMKRRN